MRYTTALSLALTMLLAANCAYAELPSEDDPPPFADLALPVPVRADSTGQLSTSVPPACPAGPFVHVGELGDPKKLIFAGVTSFPVDDVRNALQSDLKYQAASRPSNDTSNFLRVLEERVRFGYLNSGFPEVTVHAWCNDKISVVLVEVNEGPSFRQGEIVVEGADIVDAAALRKWLMSRQMAPNWNLKVGAVELPKLSDHATPDWTPGDKLIDTPQRHAALRTSIRWALADQGLVGGSFHTRCESAKEHGISNLVISFITSPQPAVLSSIEATGLKRDSQEQLAKYLEIAKGMRANGTLLRRIDTQLSESCRYWNHKVILETAPETDAVNSQQPPSVKLALDLEEYTPAPPLDQPLSEVDDILRTAAAWINRSGDGESKFAVVCEGKVVDAVNPALTMEFQPVAIAADGQVAADIRYTSTDWSANHAVLISSQSAEIVDWVRRERFCLDTPIQPSFRIRLSPDHKESGEFAGKLSLAYSLKRLDADSSEEPVLSIQAVPIALVYFAHRPGAKVEVADGRLSISSGGIDIHFDAATGAIQQIRTDAGESKLTLRFDAGGFVAAAAGIKSRAKEFPNRFDPNHALSSLLIFVLDEVQSQPCVAASSDLSANCAKVRAWLEHPIIAAPLDEFDRHIVTADWMAARDGSKFCIPSELSTEVDGIESLQSTLAELCVVGADELFPRGSWPWTLIREFAFDQIAKTVKEDSEDISYAFSTKESERFLSCDTLGPLSALLFVKFSELERSNLITERERDEFYQSLFVARGLNNLSDDGFLIDIHMLTARETQFGNLYCAAAEKYCTLTDEQQKRLREALPDSCGPLLIALSERQAANPREPIAKSVETVLLDAWHHGLRGTVENVLRAHAVNVAQQTTADIEQR